MPKRNDYYSEIKDYYTNRLNELIPQLPKFVDDYMLSISQNKQVRTRLGYCEDIKTFLLFASDYLNGNYNIKEFTLDDLEKITADDIDRYMDYLSYYRIKLLLC